MSDVVSAVLSQYHVLKRLKKFGEKGVDAVLKELRQLHERMVMEPTFSNNMNKNQREDVLQYLMFPKEKRSRAIKERGYADGLKQRLYVSTEESSAPTVAIELLLLTCLLDVAKKRNVATVDVP